MALGRILVSWRFAWLDPLVDFLLGKTPNGVYILCYDLHQQASFIRHPSQSKRLVYLKNGRKMQFNTAQKCVKGVQPTKNRIIPRLFNIESPNLTWTSTDVTSYFWLALIEVRKTSENDGFVSNFSGVLPGTTNWWASCYLTLWSPSSVCHLSLLFFSHCSSIIPSISFDFSPGIGNGSDLFLRPHHMMNTTAVTSSAPPPPSSSSTPPTVAKADLPSVKKRPKRSKGGAKGDGGPDGGE